MITPHLIIYSATLRYIVPKAINQIPKATVATRRIKFKEGFLPDKKVESIVNSLAL